MRKSLMAKIASVSLGISMLGFGNVKAADNNVPAASSVTKNVDTVTDNTNVATRPLSVRQAVATGLAVFDIMHCGWINTSYLAQGKWGKFLLSIIPAVGVPQAFYNLYHCLSGTQTDGDGNLL